MPANLTPQYLEAEAEFKRAQSAEERLAALKKMWALLPKHKGTDKLQAELKAKMSEAREEVEREKRSPKKGGLSHKIPKQGAGQYVLVGAPNAGKSLLVSRLTRATPEVAAYPFTTREPVPGMMEWQDVQVQLPAAQVQGPTGARAAGTVGKSNDIVSPATYALPCASTATALPVSPDVPPRYVE